jgi:hypothetical protein
MPPFPALDLSRRLLTPLASGIVLPRDASLSGVHLKKIERPPSVPLQNIHPLGRGEFAGAGRLVALGIIALGAGHRRREGFLQPRLGRFHGSRRRLVTEVCADRLRRAQSRQRIALRSGNGRFEFGDIAGARSGRCIGSGQAEHRANKSRCYPGIGHREHPRCWRRIIAANPRPRTVVLDWLAAGECRAPRRRSRKQGPITTGFHCQEGNWPRAQKRLHGAWVPAFARTTG